MRKTFIDITDQRFGRWTALYCVDRGRAGKPTMWLCVCDCGAQRTVRSSGLRNGSSQSCGSGCNSRPRLTPEQLKINHDKAVRGWINNHLEIVRASNRKWCKANPDKRRVLQQKREARKRGVGGSWTAEEFETLKRQYGHRCVGCLKHESELKALGRKLVPDHIIPIAKSGMNIIENLQPLCHGLGGCNNKKRDTTVDFIIS